MSTKNTQVTKKCIGTIKKKNNFSCEANTDDFCFISSGTIFQICMKYKYEM